jgi:hypothetical protein
MKVLDPIPPPSERPAPLDREWLSDREIDVFGAVMYLWRLRYRLLLGLIGGLALALAYTFAQPREYSATASVMVRTPADADLQASHALPIDAIDQIASSASLRGQVTAELSRRSLLNDGQIRDLRTLVRTGADPERPAVSLLALSAVATSPALARDAANVWAELLKSVIDKVEGSRRGDAERLLAQDYPKAAARLTEQERALEELKRGHQQSLHAARLRAAVSLRQAELSSQEGLVVELAEQRKRLALTLKETAAGIAALETEVKQAESSVTSVPATQDPGAATRDSRTVRAALMEKLADARVRLRELSARDGALAVEIEQLRRSAAGARAALSGSELTLSSLELRQETEVFAKEREIALARSIFDDLERRIGASQVMVSVPESTLAAGPAAELPATPSGPDVKGPLLLGALAGLALAFAISWFVATARARGVQLR